MRRKKETEAWSISDIWLGLLILAMGCMVTVFAVLLVRKGQSWILMLFGVGSFLVGPILIFSGGAGIVQSIWSARPRSYRDVIEAELERPDPSGERSER